MTKPQESLYWGLWSAASIQQGWNRLPAAQLTEKRHAAHYQALKLTKSHKDFTNADCDKVFRLFKVLADSDNVEKRVDLDQHVHGDKGERTRLLFRIGQLAPKPYVEAVMRDKFDTIRFADLDLHQLELLKITLIERKRANARRDEIATVTAPTESEDNTY